MIEVRNHKKVTTKDEILGWWEKLAPALRAQMENDMQSCWEQLDEAFKMGRECGWSRRTLLLIIKGLKEENKMLLDRVIELEGNK